jgi:hypothetical protein
VKEVVMHAGHKVLVEVDVSSLMIVGDPQGIFSQ